MKKNLFFIFLGVFLIIFSNNIYSILFQPARPLEFIITKIISINFLGVASILIGLLYKFKYF